MITEEKVVFSSKEIARMEIRNFVNEGLIDVQEGKLLDFEEVFDELESRYENA